MKVELPFPIRDIAAEWIYPLMCVYTVLGTLYIVS